MRGTARAHAHASADTRASGSMQSQTRLVVSSTHTSFPDTVSIYSGPRWLIVCRLLSTSTYQPPPIPTRTITRHVWAVKGKRAGMEYYCARVACSPACVAIGDLSIRGTGGPPVRWFVIKSRNSVEPCSTKGVEPPCETHKPRCVQSSEFIRAYQQQTD